MKTQFVLMLAMLATLSTASADIYRWVDAQGRVHYSDKPVDGAKRVKDVDSRPSDPEVVAERVAAEQKQREQAEAAAQEQLKDETAAKTVEKDVKKIQEERCREAEKAYKTATESQRLYRTGKDGEREYLTNEEITTTRINTAKAREEACGKPPGK